MNGIDVSKHNGKIDWQSVKASGKSISQKNVKIAV